MYDEEKKNKKKEKKKNKDKEKKKEKENKCLHTYIICFSVGHVLTIDGCSLSFI